MDCNPPGFSVHGIVQARILECIGIPFSRGSAQPRDWTWVSCIAFFTESARKSLQLWGSVPKRKKWVMNMRGPLTASGTLFIKPATMCGSAASSLLLYLVFLLRIDHPRLPLWLSGKESLWQCRRYGFSPWSRKIPHAAKQLNPCAWAIITEPVLYSPGTTTAEPMCHNYWSLCALEPVLHSKRSCSREKSMHCNYVVAPHSPQRKVWTAMKTQHRHNK